MQTVMSILTAIKDGISSLVAKAPFSTGLAMGYLLHGPIGLAIKAVRAALGLL